MQRNAHINVRRRGVAYRTCVCVWRLREPNILSENYLCIINIVRDGDDYEPMLVAYARKKCESAQREECDFFFCEKFVHNFIVAHCEKNVFLLTTNKIMQGQLSKMIKFLKNYILGNYIYMYSTYKKQSADVSGAF